MSNNYKYIDVDYKYTYPQTSVLKNLVNITNADDLLFVESAAVSKRTKELAENPIKIKNSQTLLDIHKYLFQDIYEWAGKKRMVEISKDGKQFFPTTHFGNAFVFIDNIIEEYRKIGKEEISNISDKLAEILDTINFLHPFREGNGRTQREFIRILALEKGLILDLNPADNKDVYERYMQGTINADVKLLSNLINERLKKKE
jgi:cell filamentation protein